MLRSLTAWTLTCIAGATASAQGPARLVERVERPLLYLSAGLAEHGGGLDTLFEDPVLQTLLVGSEAAEDPRFAVLRSLARLIGASDDLELALTGLLPRPGGGALPLLAFRARLEERSAEVARQLLEGESLASAHRTIAGRQVYLLRGGARRPGSLVEMALVDGDLLVSNHGQAMVQILGEDAATGDLQTLDRDPAFRGLRGRIGMEAPELLVYCDWERLWAKVGPGVEPGNLLGLELLGIPEMRQVVFAMERDGERSRSTLLGQPRGEIPGLLAVSDSVRPAELLRNLPMGGFGALTLRFDPTRLARSGGRAAPSGMFASVLSERASGVGLDMEEQVLPRLGRLGAFRLLLSDQGRADGGFRTAFTVAAKNRRVARDLFAESLDSMRGLGLVARESGEGRSTLRLPGGRLGSFGQIDDLLVLGMSPEAVALAAGADDALQSKEVRRRRREIGDLLDELSGGGRDRVAGAFFIDLDMLARHLGAEDGDSLLRGRHAGLLYVDLGSIRIDLVAGP